MESQEAAEEDVEEEATVEAEASPEATPEPTPTYVVEARTGLHIDYVSTPTNEATVSARATHEAQAAATLTEQANEIRTKHATVLVEHEEGRATAQAQWEADQAERAEEQAMEQRANEATYVAQLADSYAAATARADELVREATVQAESVGVQATDEFAQGEATIPVWVLVAVGGAALVAVAAIAAGLMRRRTETNFDERDGQDGNN